MAWRNEVQAREEVDNQILAKAESFARLLRSSVEFQNYLKAQQQMQRDPEAQKAIRDVQEMQRTLQRSRFLGGITPDEMSRLKYLQRIMLETPTVRKVVKAQEAMVLLCQEAASIISEVIEMDYGAACAPAGGCC